MKSTYEDRDVNGVMRDLKWYLRLLVLPFLFMILELGIIPLTHLGTFCCMLLTSLPNFLCGLFDEDGTPREGSP